jgi:hypothetical protein
MTNTLYILKREVDLMTKYLSAIYWALAMIALAAGERLGWIDRQAANTLLIVLPLVAFNMLRRSGRCALTARDA